MEAHYRTRSGRLTIKVVGDEQKELFRQLAVVQDIFDGESECGLCHSPDIKFQVRAIDGNEYFELVCTKCNAQFSFGQHKNGKTLFPKRRGPGGPLPDGGWFHYRGQQE